MHCLHQTHLIWRISLTSLFYVFGWGRWAWELGNFIFLTNERLSRIFKDLSNQSRLKVSIYFSVWNNRVLSSLDTTDIDTRGKYKVHDPNTSSSLVNIFLTKQILNDSTFQNDGTWFNEDAKMYRSCLVFGMLAGINTT